MTIRSESRITIASSVPEVWAYVCDVERWPEWAPTVRECWVARGAPLQPGSRVEQRAKWIFGFTRFRAQDVTAVEAPRRLAFAGPMGTSAARWGMELEPMDDRQTEAEMWVEVDLGGLMRAIPGPVLNGRIRRVMDREMTAIKAAVESARRTQAATKDVPPEMLARTRMRVSTRVPRSTCSSPISRLRPPTRAYANRPILSHRASAPHPATWRLRLASGSAVAIADAAGRGRPKRSSAITRRWRRVGLDPAGLLAYR
jgi:hypothetical protein